MLSKHILKEAFRNTLPGLPAQLHLAPLSENNKREVVSDAKIAAVMALINFHNLDNPSIILIQRSSKDSRDRHAGQISLPGGKQEYLDKNLMATALRETKEEIGIPASKIEVIGRLTPLYIPVSGFNVYPFVGIGEITNYIKQDDEVESIIEWPMTKFLAPNAILHKDLNPRPGIILKNVPYFDCCGHVLWGATAMILSELREMLKQGQIMDS